MLGYKIQSSHPKRLLMCTFININAVCISYETPPQEGGGCLYETHERFLNNCKLL